MDIQKWLASADLDRAPDESRGRESRARKHDNGGASRLPETSSELRQLLANRGPDLSAHDKYHVKRDPPSSRDSCRSSSSSSGGSSASRPPSSELYKRRKRHKTREDLYEPHSGVRKKRSRPKKEDSHKRKKRTEKSKTKHHRTEKPLKLAKPGQKLLKDFNAPNVGSSRLIVRIS